ncbi:hypothetical protein [Paenibacillus sp. Marseille-Q4541]|uniref:hypothetical protein n=1 Tax=Paenibacillus sp. Marseille-Q4541 TaxID=2831522 RepID=UPI001BA99675|nr:hypothetical protein [Paenibacillus sp. Marseille-Q4541]
MKRRNHWILFIVLLLSLTILSPSLDIAQDQKTDDGGNITDLFSTPAPQTTQKNKPLSVLVSMDNEEFTAFQRHTQNTAKEMGMEIDLSNVDPSDFYSEFKNAFMMGESPDAVLIDNRYIKWFARKGFASPITGGDGNGAAGASFDSLLRAGEWNGYRWSIPMDMDPYVYAEYRTKETSTGPLQSTSTTEEWKSQLAEWDESMDRPFYFDGEDPVAFASWLKFQGIVPEASEVFRVANEEEENVSKQIQSIQALFPYIKTERNTRSYDKPDFQAGIITLSDLLPIYREELSTYINNDVESQALAVMGRSFVVSPKSTQKEAILEFLAKLTSPGSAKTWFLLSGKLPVHQSLYTASDMSDITNAIPLQALEESVEQSLLQDQDRILSDPEKSQKAADSIEQFVQGHISFKEYEHHIKRLFGASE